MKKATVAAILLLFLSACPAKKTPETSQPSPETPAATGAPTSGAETHTYKPVPAEVYWEIQLERLEATRDHYRAILEVYKKYGGDTPEAREEMMDLQRKNREKMQEIFRSREYESSDFYPYGQDRRKVLEERQQYLQDHPELKVKYQALAREIRDLREQVNAYMPAAPAPGPPPGTKEKP